MIACVSAFAVTTVSLNSDLISKKGVKSDGDFLISHSQSGKALWRIKLAKILYFKIHIRVEGSGWFAWYVYKYYKPVILFQSIRWKGNRRRRWADGGSFAWGCVSVRWCECLLLNGFYVTSLLRSSISINYMVLEYSPFWPGQGTWQFSSKLWC